MRMMRLSILPLVLLVGIASRYAEAQPAAEEALELTSQRRLIDVSAVAVYQSYDDHDLNVSQFSIPISVSIPIGRATTLSLRASRASVTSSEITDLSGATDPQVVLAYARSAGAGSVVFSLGINLPAGKQELTTEEFQTAAFLSQTAFDYRVPSYGQGLGLSPSLVWAIPIGSNAVIGLGGTYNYRGSYKPIDTLEDDYTPGDEVLVTGGFDARLGPTSALSLDVTYTLYSTDKLGEQEVFEAGAKTTLTALYRYLNGFNELRILGLYRRRAESEVLMEGTLTRQVSQTIPDQIMLQVTYRLRLSRSFSATLLVAGRKFDETEIVEERTLFDVGVLPSMRVSKTATIVTRFIYTAGTITGFEASGGLVMRF